MADTDPTLLEPKLLRLLDLLYTTRSVTKSAEQLGQSQPTVSIWLGRLRTQFNDPLFVRTPDGMQPTPRTDGLIATVREVLEGLRRLSESEAVFDPAISRREFRIFMTDASHVTLLLRLFSHVRALAPQVRLEAATIDASLVPALQSGEADLALGLVRGLEAGQEAGFYQQSLFGQDWICLCNARHPRIGNTFTLQDYLAESHIGIVSGTGYQLLDSTLKALGVERRVLLELPGFLGLAAILSNNDLVATLPRQIGETLAQAAGLRVQACPLPIPPFTVKQYWYVRYHHDAASRWLRGVVAELFMDSR
ncbi:LysR family transcriptional regulator [Rhodoferax sp.]|uniref:LysR family transcriptional regulator n=1 Tax=Rhodoferax sp. TaxID=50421 RepID=UPI0025D3DB39|nr:LysR family transcriptional regulator [Rhodoferax sp.]